MSRSRSASGADSWRWKRRALAGVGASRTLPRKRPPASLHTQRQTDSRMRASSKTASGQAFSPHSDG